MHNNHFKTNLFFQFLGGWTFFRSDHGLKDGSNLKIAFFSGAPHRDQATTNNREIKTTNNIMIVKLKLLKRIENQKD